MLNKYTDSFFKTVNDNTLNDYVYYNPMFTDN